MPKSKYNSSHKKGYDVEKVLNERVAHIARIRKADAAKKARGTWVSRLKKNVQGIIKKYKKGRHSPAGKRYLRKK